MEQRVPLVGRPGERFAIMDWPGWHEELESDHYELYEDFDKHSPTVELQLNFLRNCLA